jgi:hypothetical protein
MVLAQFEQVIPVIPAGLVIFAILIIGSVFFIPRQQSRGFYMMTYPRVVLMAFASAFVVTVAQLTVATEIPFSSVPLLASAASLLYLLMVTIFSDFSIHKIPTESAWLPAFIGIAGFCVTFIGGNEVTWDLSRIFVLLVLAVLPIVAFISLLFSGGGAADYRVSMAGFIATFWWVSADSIFYGLIAFVLFTLIGRLFFYKTLPSGKRATPAGPAYVSIFFVSALTTILFAV